MLRFRRMKTLQKFSSGKFYAAQTKRHGGIALDLGSLVEG